jgi:hypothetical protein
MTESEMAMRILPEIERTVLAPNRLTMMDTEHGLMRWYAGPIEPGEIYAWEPDLPHARQLMLVTRVANRAPDEPAIWCAPIADGQAQHDKAVWNDESRFREAVVPTIMNPWPTEPAQLTSWRPVHRQRG